MVLYEPRLLSRYSDGLRVGLSVAKDFSLLHNAQAVSGAHSASYPMGTGGPFPWIKRLGREADHLPPCRAVDKNGGAIRTLPPYAFMASCLSN
jgi:hypothetical protein